HRNVPRFCPPGPRGRFLRGRRVVRDAGQGREVARRPFPEGPRDPQLRSPERRARPLPGGLLCFMRKLTTADLKSLDEYEKVRPILRRQIIELKEIRRVALGDNISIVFENFQTMQWQTQEMLRAERITSPEAIQEEVDTYNELIPDK